MSVKQGGINYHFWVFGMTRPEIELQSPGSLANTLTILPLVVTDTKPKITLTKNSNAPWLPDEELNIRNIYYIGIWNHKNETRYQIWKHLQTYSF